MKKITNSTICKVYMSERNTYYVTTPIYYVNDKPHIGHAYSTIAADVLARYHRLKGDDVVFSTGTDENSQKNVEAAQKAGIEDISAYLDMQSAVWAQVWDGLNITHTDFIRTTEARHKKAVEKFFATVYAKGDIYKGKYQGYYCKGCEEFKLEGDLVEGKCPIHLTAPEMIEEDNYFFAASKYRDRLLAYIEENQDFIQPASRRNEIVNYIKDHFTDVSISRQSVKVGIPLPIDPTHVVYVWFDALINYLTVAGYGEDEARFARQWPADMHIVGKDIIKFHCALWPAMLMAAELPLPRMVFANGFFTNGGQKISKSLGNAIDPVELGVKYGLDTVRYFLLREIPFGQDGDFSYDRLAERYNADLAKGLGNFVSRVITLAEKLDTREGVGMTTAQHEAETEICDKVMQGWIAWEAALDRCEFDSALEVIWGIIRWGDRYIEHTKPWALQKEDAQEFAAVMKILIETVRHISIMLYPIMPQIAEQIWSQLGLTAREHLASWGSARTWYGVPVREIKKEGVLFPSLS